MGRYSNYSSYTGYWTQHDKTITLRPGSVIKKNTRPCRVL